PLYRLSVEQYHAMIRAGVLSEQDAVELLEGLLVQKMTRNPPHAIALRRTRLALEAAIPEGWMVDIQEAITLADSEPEPDLAVIQGDPREEEGRHPIPGEIELVVEVADATLSLDRNEKLRTYARARLPVYWIVNLVDRRIEVTSKPSGPRRSPSYKRQKN